MNLLNDEFWNKLNALGEANDRKVKAMLESSEQLRDGVRAMLNGVDAEAKQLRADLDQCRQLLVAAWTLQTPSEANAEIWNRICTFLIAKGWIGSGERF